MHLSKVRLAAGKLNNAYEWHQALWTLFPHLERGTSAPFLYQMEQVDLRFGASLLLHSSVEPVLSSDLAQVVATKPLKMTVHAGQRLGFRLLANPTKCITDQEAKEGKRNRGKCRVPLIKEADQVAWLQRRLQGAANLEELRVQTQSPLYFRKGGRAGKIVSTLFEGRFQVDQAHVLETLWRSGIGPAKAFGCGLLLIRRV